MNKPSTYGFFLKIMLISYLLVGIATGLQAQWEAVYDNNPNFPNLETVAFSTAQNGLAAGANGIIIRTDDSGLNWDTILVEPNGLDIVDLQFTSVTTAYALGQSPTPACGSGDEGLIAQTHNFGATWNYTYTDTSLYAIHFPNPITGYAVGTCGAVYKTSDSGNTWQWQSSNIAAENLTSVFFIDELVGFVAGPNNTFWKTMDGGDSWTDLDAAVSGVNEFYDITFPSANVGYLSSNFDVFKTEDGGDSWAPVNNPFNGFKIMSFINEDIGWLGGNSGAVYKTMDGGNIWLDQNTSNGFFGIPLLDLFFLDENQGFIVGSQKYFKTTTGGESLPDIQYLSGNVFLESDPTNCMLDAAESGLGNWIISIVGNNTYYATTDVDGNYFAAVETGNYDISLVLPNGNWLHSCQAIYNETLSSPFDTLILNLPAKEAVDCPVLDVDVSTHKLTHCSNNTYTVRYLNTGTATAISPYAKIELDEDLTMLSNNWTSVNGNVYTFDLPDVAVGEHGDFSFDAFLECNPFVGQTHTVEAEIYPNDFCLPPSVDWSGASLSVEALCEGDSVAFTIKNIGGVNMMQTTDFVIIEDHVLFHPVDINLESGQEVTYVYYPIGTTLRMEVEQVANHPGRSNPSVSYEGCTLNSNGTISLGQVNPYPEDDADVFLSLDYQESTAEAVTTIKRAYPKGYGVEHFIEANVDLDYHILFQNNSTDTVYTVIVQDTLSQWLDASSIRQGAASHPYSFALQDNGMARFVFSNIQLPPTTSGFVKFRVRQKADNPDGTLIENTACISYDYGLNNKTNTTTHLIGTDFMETVDTALLYGVVQNENGQNVALVNVFNNWQNLVKTDTSGYYHLDNVDPMWSYTLSPQKDTNLLNGVEALDLLLMQKHIVGSELLDSPYKMIAADVDRSGSISTVDVLGARRAILLLADTFPNNHSWRFITEPYDFADMANPFAEAFPEAFLLKNPTTNNRVNFTGIKIGDVDNSNDPMNLLSADEKDKEELPLFIDEQRVKEGHYYNVPMYIDGSVNLAALQFALQFDTAMLAFEGLHTDATTICRSDNFGYRFLENGVITACWFDHNVLETNHPEDSDITLFQLRFLAKEDGRLSNSITLRPELVDGLAFERKDDLQKDLNRKLTSLQFNTRGQISTIGNRSTLEIFPNPTSDDDLWIRYTLDKESKVKINIVNSLGQPVQSILFKERRSKGTYTYKWNASGLPEGSYFIHLNTNGAPMVSKFVKVK